MKLAKPRIDIGLATNNLEPMLAFWRGDAGAVFDHVLPIRPGHDQHRHDVNGSVLKINHPSSPLPDAPPSGYRQLLIARNDLEARQDLTDPDGNRVSLVPLKPDGVRQIGIVLAVRDLDTHRRFYREALGLDEECDPEGVAFRAGETLLILRQSPDVTVDPPIQGRGWRYITFQIFKVDEEHARVLGAGGTEGMAPVTLGRTARISMVRDPDGNWIELSQRASIVGSLD